MERKYFSSDDLIVIEEALRISEDRVTDFYKLSHGQWLKHPYEVVTARRGLLSGDHKDAFAVLKKVRALSQEITIERYLRELYLICLQDHLILKAIVRDSNLQLFPLMVYVFTHELIHIIRFERFQERFDLDAKRRGPEERIVHDLTSRVLSGVPCKGIDYVIDCYKNHKINLQYGGGAGCLSMNTCVPTARR